MSEVLNVEAIFGENVFSLGKMRERLPKKVYGELTKVMAEGGDLSLETADVVAKAMKDWAVEKGATHYTHWFQPLTGITAEKHDAFVTNPDESGHMLMEFSGKELIKGESDASSFPSGGLRSTFEARGYTAWDLTSPAFIKESAIGAVLCIPTVFCAYTGEALDQKTPLLRSMEAVSEQALRIVRLFGDTEATKVTPSVGAEQEYFLVDRNKYLQRKDLIYAGRTLFGAPAPKGQEMDDHYYGTIRERVGAYMRDLNIELWKLGVSAKTQHNEVAPAQHELAPIFSTANIEVDHNQIIMETMKRVAIRHDMNCLLHEKPFAGINGSGKHNNWSLVTDNGVNLLEPGETPNQNIQFLLVLACVLKAVDRHADLLKQSASNVGNDQRLGAHEAPPTIMSVFLGEQLEDVVEQLIETGEAKSCLHGSKLMTGVSHTDPKGTEFALKVMTRLREATDTWKRITGIGFGLYGTPAESLCYRFARIDRERFGIIEDVTDKGYYTNSYHVDVREKIDAFSKFTFESQFQTISSGGAISYVEIPNMRHNLTALEEIVKFIYENIQYAEFNTKSDYCHVCGYDGEIEINDKMEWECPQCHNKDQDKMNVTRRTCGYLGENFWNVGKTKEIKARVLHC